ncbi:hypothetical protein OEG84_09325 [Hoeflea sp. G2-23]|uniref:Ribbon-helix-helix protein CopG domain-containing protein n=1 Tax=Hoeflea algicola TaxID=2983763 RepID=A0ABT3Z7Z8_9HYPH|nr:hypothetical protein [Hoeflea algicola]MCY0147907.1 hypothetical protein [Hoeflea algicola]
MITINLPDELEQLLARYADEMGMSKEDLALRAIKDRMEDLAAGEAAIANDDGEHIPLADILAEFGDGTDENGNSLHAAE